MFFTSSESDCIKTAVVAVATTVVFLVIDSVYTSKLKKENKEKQEKLERELKEQKQRKELGYWILYDQSFFWKI